MSTLSPRPTWQNLTLQVTINILPTVQNSTPSISGFARGEICTYNLSPSQIPSTLSGIYDVAEARLTDDDLIRNTPNSTFNLNLHSLVVRSVHDTTSYYGGNDINRWSADRVMDDERCAQIYEMWYDRFVGVELEPGRPRSCFMCVPGFELRFEVGLGAYWMQ